MQYSKPSQILVDEHELILSVIEAVETIAKTAGDTEFSAEFYSKAFDFFANFADKCHHGKEEVHLFPMLEERGILSNGGPIGCMLRDHNQGRSHVAAIRDAMVGAKEGDSTSRQVVREEAMAFCSLLRQHIQKENQILFVVGDQMMSDADKELLVKKFECEENNETLEKTSKKYVAVAAELRALAGLPPTAACSIHA